MLKEDNNLFTVLLNAKQDLVINFIDLYDIFYCIFDMVKGVIANIFAENYHLKRYTLFETTKYHETTHLCLKCLKMLEQ